MKAAARQIVPDRILGAVDYVRFPSRRVALGGPFNGQPARQALFREMVTKLRPHAIIETGTYLGTTTEFMAQTGLPIYTIEADPRNYGFVCARFWRTPNVTSLCGDSRDGLRELLDGSLRNIAPRTLFFYLDAHWNADLPLAEELDIVFSRCPSAIAILDDFEVPFDRGYGYDDYGPGKALTASYIEPLVSRYQLQTFGPSIPSAADSGLRRGCVVLAKKARHGKALTKLALLCLVEGSVSRAGTSR